MFWHFSLNTVLFLDRNPHVSSGTCYLHVSAVFMWENNMSNMSRELCRHCADRDPGLVKLQDTCTVKPQSHRAAADVECVPQGKHALSKVYRSD